MPKETQQIEYTCTGCERANDTVCLAEFEAEMRGTLAQVGTGQATAFLRFNKDQKPGVVYRLLVERSE